MRSFILTYSLISLIERIFDSVGFYSEGTLIYLSAVPSQKLMMGWGGGDLLHGTCDVYQCLLSVIVIQLVKVHSYVGASEWVAALG